MKKEGNEALLQFVTQSSNYRLISTLLFVFGFFFEDPINGNDLGKGAKMHFMELKFYVFQSYNGIYNYRVYS